MGVFLLTPTKKAYLRYYRDLEVDLMNPDGADAGLEYDTESLLPKASDAASLGPSHEPSLQVKCLAAMHLASLLPGACCASSLSHKSQSGSDSLTPCRKH